MFSPHLVVAMLLNVDSIFDVALMMMAWCNVDGVDDGAWSLEVWYHHLPAMESGSGEVIWGVAACSWRGDSQVQSGGFWPGTPPWAGGSGLQVKLSDAGWLAWVAIFNDSLSWNLRGTFRRNSDFQHHIDMALHCSATMTFHLPWQRPGTRAALDTALATSIPVTLDLLITYIDNRGS